jgi:GT2 family glycosyltransferase
MTESKPRVAIIVLNWNRKDDTVACLKSIGRLSTFGYDLSVIVVDNASTDGSLEEFSKITNLEFRVIENEQNIGFAAGNNVGIKAAMDLGADFIMILNNDTLVDRGLVVSLLKAADKYKDVGIFAPKIYFAPGYEFQKDRYPKFVLGKVIWFAGGTIDWPNMLGSNFGVDDVDRGQYDQEREVDFATGACMFIRRKVIEKVGVFDEKYGLYLEDADLSQRAKKENFKIIFVPNAYLWHKVGQSSAIGSSLNDYFISRNRLLFGFKYASRRTKLALIRESLKLLFMGRKWQKIGVRDFYLHRLGKGSWK